MLTQPRPAADPAERLLAELRAARDDARLAQLSEANPDGSLDEFESASFVINHLSQIRYALQSGMPVIAWEPALRNEAGGEYVLRAIRQFEEQAKLLVLAYVNGDLTLDELRAGLVLQFRVHARNSYIAGRRAMGDLSPLSGAEEDTLADLYADDEEDLSAQLDIDPSAAAAAGGGVAGAIASMIFDPSNYLGSGLPGDPFAGLPAPIGAGKKSAEQIAKDAAKKAAKAGLSPVDSSLRKFEGAMAGYGDRIRSLSHAGEMSALAKLPEGATLVWWTLGAADHCVDCIRLADASPFYLATLQSNGIYPGSGHTRCGGHCRCGLDYDIPSQVCADPLTDEAFDAEGLIESADGRRLNVWIQEATACALPINVSALQADEDYGLIDDAEAFDWNADVSDLIAGDLEDTVEWSADVLGKALPEAVGKQLRKAFEFLANDLGPAASDMRLTRYSASGSEYVAAWRRSGGSVIFDAGITVSGPTALDAEFTLRALHDLAAYAKEEGLAFTVAGDYAGPGMAKWLNAIGSPQTVAPGAPPTTLIDWTKLGPGPAPSPGIVLVAPIVPPPAGPASVLSDAATGLGGATAKKRTLTDAAGDQWLWKPPDWGDASVAGEVAASQIGKALGLNVVDVSPMTFGGDLGTVQRLLPDVHPLQVGEPWEWTPEQVQEFARQHVFDFLIANPDAHIGQMVVDGAGRLIGVDKSAAFVWLPVEVKNHLDDPTKLFGSWKALFHTDHTEQLAKWTPDDILPLLAKVEALPDSEFLDVLDETLTAMTKGKPVIPSAPTPTLDELRAMALQRKHDLRASMEQTYRTMLGKYDPADLPVHWREWLDNGGTFDALDNAVAAGLVPVPDPKLVALLDAQPLPSVPMAAVHGPAPWSDAAGMISDLSARHPGMAFGDLALLPWETARVVGQTFDEMAARFGPIDGLKGVRFDPTGVTHLASVPGGRIVSLGDEFGSRAALDAAAAEVIASGYGTPGLLAKAAGGSSDAYAHGVLVHEMAHGYDGALGPQVDAWFADRFAVGKVGRNAVSPYGAKNAMEAWAETFTLAVTNPKLATTEAGRASATELAALIPGSPTLATATPTKPVWATADAMVADLEARYPGAQFGDLRKLDFGMAKASMEQMDELMTRFGAIPSFRGVRLGKASVKDASAYVGPLPNGEAGRALFLPPSRWGDPAEAAAHVKSISDYAKGSTYQAVAAADPTDVTGWVKAVTAHEVGHAYMSTGMHVRLGAKGDPVRDEVDAWFAKFQKTFKKDKLTSYAAQDADEGWAEAFAVAVGAAPIDDPRTAELRAILDKHFPPGEVAVGPVIGTNVSHVSDALTSRYQKWWDALSPEQKAALDKYKSGGSDQLNDFLRGQVSAEAVGLMKAIGNDVEALRDAVDSLFDDIAKRTDPQVVAVSTQMQKPLIVYRGRSVVDVPVVGDIVHEPGFLSTTIDPKVAAQFATGVPSAQPVVYRIALPKGTPAAWLDDFVGKHGDEFELLLQRNSQFRVVASHADTVIDGTSVTVVDLVPEPKALVPQGPPVPAETNAWKPGDAQQYLLDPATPPLNAPLAEWSGYVPPEPALPATKATAEEIADAKAAAEAVRIRWDDPGVTVAVSNNPEETKAAVAAGWTYEKVGNLRIVAKTEADLEPLRAYVAVEGQSSSDDAFWALLGYDGAAMEAIDTAATISKGKRLTAGVMVFEPDGRVWVLAPKNKFAGYENTVIKGGVDDGESAAAGALRELREEAGLSAELDGFLGDYANSDGTGITRMYVGHRTGGGPLFADAKETYRVRLLTPDEAKKALTRYGKPEARDQSILADAVEAVVGKPQKVDYLIPAGDLPEFVSVTAPANVVPPAIPSTIQPTTVPTAFATDAVIPPPPSPAAAFGFDQSKVAGLSFTDTPPSAKFPIAQTRYKLPGGDVQPMFWKHEPHGAGTEHVFWMNSKKQVPDPVERFEAHVAMVLHHADYLTANPALVGLRVNEALLDQVPKLRELLVSAGATKPSPKTLELTRAQLDDLAKAIRSDSALVPPAPDFPTAPLVPPAEPVAVTAAGSAAADLGNLSLVVDQPASFLTKLEWSIPGSPTVTLTVTHYPVDKLVEVTGDLTALGAKQELSVLHATSALVGKHAAALGVPDVAFRTSGTAVVGQWADAIGAVSTNAGWVTGPKQLVAFGDTLAHDMAAAGVSPAWLDETLLPDALPMPGVSTPTSLGAQMRVSPESANSLALQKVSLSADNNVIEETAIWAEYGASAMFRTERTADGLTMVFAGMDLPSTGAAGRAAMVGAELRRLADVTDIHPDIESLWVTATAWGAFPKSMQDALLSIGVPGPFGGAGVRLTSEQLRGIRDGLANMYPIADLPSIIGSVPETVGYSVEQAQLLVKNASVSTSATWTNVADLQLQLFGDQAAFVDDAIGNVIQATALPKNADAMAAALYVMGGKALTLDRSLVVPESLLSEDMAAALVYAGGKRKGGAIVVESDVLGSVRNELIPPAAVAAPPPPAPVLPITVPAGDGAKLLDGAASAVDEPKTWNGQAMKVTGYPAAGAGHVVWRRLGNVLETHAVQTTSNDVLKAHLIRMAQAADAAPKITALRFTPDAVAAIKGSDFGLLLTDVGAATYAGGMKLTRDQLLAVRDKLVTDAAATFEAPAAPVLTWLAPDVAAAAKKLTHTAEQLKQGFTRFTYDTPGSEVRIIERGLSSQIVWARTQGNADDVARLTASVRHLMKIASVDMASKPGLASIRFENLAQLPGVFEVLLKQAGATGTDKVLVLAREDALKLAKQLSDDVNGTGVAEAVAAAVAPPIPPPVSDVQLGLLGLAQHDPDALADLQAIAIGGKPYVGVTEEMYADTFVTKWKTTAGPAQTWWRLDPTLGNDIVMTGVAGPASAVQATFLRQLEVHARSVADGAFDHLRIGAGAFVGQPGMAMREHLIGLGAETFAGDVVLNAHLAAKVADHIASGAELLPAPATIGSAIPPVSVAETSSLGAQFGYDHLKVGDWTPAVTAAENVQAVVDLPHGTFSLHTPGGAASLSQWETGSNLGDPFLIWASHIGPLESAIAAIPTFASAVEATGVEIRIWSGVYADKAELRELLIAAGGVEGAYGIDLGAPAFASLAQHIDSDLAMHVLPKGSGAPGLAPEPTAIAAGFDPAKYGTSTQQIASVYDNGDLLSGTGAPGDPKVFAWSPEITTSLGYGKDSLKLSWLQLNGVSSGSSDLLAVAVSQLSAAADLVPVGGKLTITPNILTNNIVPPDVSKAIADIAHAFGGTSPVGPSYIDLSYDQLQTLKATVSNVVFGTPVTNLPPSIGAAGWATADLNSAVEALASGNVYSAGKGIDVVEFQFGGGKWSAATITDAPFTYEMGVLVPDGWSLPPSPATKNAAAAAFTVHSAKVAKIAGDKLVIPHEFEAAYPGLALIGPLGYYDGTKHVIPHDALDELLGAVVTAGDATPTFGLTSGVDTAAALGLPPEFGGPAPLPAGPSIEALKAIDKAALAALPEPTVTQMAQGFRSYVYGGAGSMKVRVTGKSISVESLNGASKLEVGFAGLRRIGEELADSPGVSAVRVKLAAAAAIDDVLGAMGGKAAVGGWEFTRDEFLAGLKAMEADLAGAATGALPSPVAAGQAGTQHIMPLHQKFGMDAAAIKSKELGYDGWPTYYYGGSSQFTVNIKHPGILGSPNYYGESLPLQSSFYGRRQKQRVLWTYSPTPKQTGVAAKVTAADIDAASWHALQTMAAHAADNDLPLFVTVGAARPGATADILFAYGAKKKASFLSYGEVWQLDKTAVKKLSADMKADPLVAMAVTPPPAAAIPSPLATGATIPPAAVPDAPPLGTVVPTPVAATSIADTYGFKGDELKAVGNPKSEVIGSTPHGDVTKSGFLNLDFGNHIGDVTWAHEKLGDAFVLRLRAATGQTIGSDKATALAAAFMSVFPDAMGTKWTQLLVNKKALDGTKIGDMLAAFGAKETKDYFRLTAEQVQQLSAAIVKDEADWVGKAVVAPVSAAVPTSTVKLVAGVPAVPTPAFVYGFDAAQVKAWSTASPVRRSGLINTGETKDILSPAGTTAGLAWSVSPSGKAIGVFDVLKGATDAETRDAAFAMLSHVIAEGQARWTGQQGERLFFKPDAYDKVPGLRQLLIDAGGKPTQYPKLGEAIELDAKQAQVLFDALSSNTLGGLKVSIAKTSEYLQFDSSGLEKLLAELPSERPGGFEWQAAGDKVTALVSITRERAAFTGLAGGSDTARAMATVAELNHIADIGVNQLTVGPGVLGLVPKLDKFLLANGASVEGDSLVLDAVALNNVRKAITKDALPVLLGGKPLPFSVVDELAANAPDAASAAVVTTVKSTTSAMTATIKGQAIAASVTVGPSNLYWGGINVPATATVGNVRAASAAHLRSLVNWAAQDASITKLDVDVAVFAQAPNLRAVLQKYGATETAGAQHFLSLNRTQIAKLRKDIEAEFAAYAPTGTSYIGKQAALIQWPAADTLTPVPLVDPVTGKALSGQTAKNLFRDAEGNQWLFKPGESGRGAATDKAVAELAKMLGLPVPPVRHYTVIVNGKPVSGSLQKMIPSAKSIKSLSELSPSQTSEMLRHSVLDWLTNNDDAHIGNWLIDADNHLWSIDKTRSWTTLNDGAHDLLRSSNMGNGGGQPLLFKFWTDVKANPKLLANIKPQDIAPTLRAIRNLSDDEFRRIVEPVAAAMNRGKYAGKPEAMVDAMLKRKHEMASDFETYFRHEVAALPKTDLPPVWKKWLDEGGVFNLDATPEDLWRERLAELNGIFGTYSPDVYSAKAKAGHLAKVRSEIQAYFGSGASGKKAGTYGSELIRPRLNPAQEQEWRQLQEWAMLNIVADAAVTAPNGREQAELLRRWFNPETGKFKLIRSTNRYADASGRLDNPAAYVKGMQKDGVRNMIGTSMGTHTTVAAHGGVFYYMEVNPDQVFSSWALGYGYGASESEILAVDVTPDQVVHIVSQNARLDLSKWQHWDGGPLYPGMH